jgi:hypothetical protein
MKILNYFFLATLFFVSSYSFGKEAFTVPHLSEGCEGENCDARVLLSNEESKSIGKIEFSTDPVKEDRSLRFLAKAIVKDQKTYTLTRKLGVGVVVQNQSVSPDQKSLKKGQQVSFLRYNSRNVRKLWTDDFAKRKSRGALRLVT